MQSTLHNTTKASKRTGGDSTSFFVVAGVTVAGVALGSRLVVSAAKNFGTRSSGLRTGTGSSSSLFSSLWKRPGGAAQGYRNFYKGGFEAEMTRAEAALILGVRQGASKEKIRLAHRRIMLANHPDNGGSDYMASKINEAKDTMLKELD